MNFCQISNIPIVKHFINNVNEDEKSEIPGNISVNSLLCPTVNNESSETFSATAVSKTIPENEIFLKNVTDQVDENVINSNNTQAQIKSLSYEKVSGNFCVEKVSNYVDSANTNNAIKNGSNKISTIVLSSKNDSVSKFDSQNPVLNSNVCIQCSDKEGVSINPESDYLCEKHFQCNFCDKKFSNKQNCDRHYRTHTNDKPYECNVCGRRFPFQRSRDRHYRTHTNEKAYECNICAKRFSRNQGLKSHVLTHTKEKPHQCELCKKRFPRIGSLRQHYRLHTNERPYDCEVCGRSFSLKRNRDKHVRVVHMHEKPFKCVECNKKFSSQKTMQCHLTTHTNEKPFLCDVCNKGYSHKASLTLHCKQHLK